MQGFSFFPKRGIIVLNIFGVYPSSYDRKIVNADYAQFICTQASIVSLFDPFTNTFVDNMKIETNYKNTLTGHMENFQFKYQTGHIITDWVFFTTYEGALAELIDTLPYHLKKGTCRTYYPDGSLKKHVVFDNNGKRERTHYSWYPNGNLEKIENFKKNRRCGDQNYFYPTGKRSKYICYKYGHAKGELLIWDPNGKLVINKKIC